MLDSIKISRLSSLLMTSPNCFFDSVEYSEDKDNFNVNLKIATFDCFRNPTKSFVWADNPEYSKYLKIKTVVITDAEIFEKINKNNYLDILEIEKNDFQKNVINLSNFIGDKDAKKHEVSYYENEEILYKFYYEASIKVKKSTFIGFVTYMYFDSYELAKEIDFNIINLKEENKFFSPEKYNFIKANSNQFTPLDKIQRIITSDSKREIWISNYFLNSDGLVPYYTVNKTNIRLQLQENKISLINKSVFEQETTENLSIKKRKNQKPFLLSSFSEGYQAIDKEGDFRCYFFADLANITVKTSKIYSMIQECDVLKSPDSFNESNDLLRSFAGIVDYRVERTEIITGNKKDILVDQVDLSFNGLKKSNIKMFVIEDDELKHKQLTKYSYKFYITINDNYRELLRYRCNQAVPQLDNLKKYINYCKSSSKKTIDSVHINYNFNSDRFTKKFIDEQLLENSMWRSCLEIPNLIISLHGLLPNEVKMRNVYYKDIYDVLDPSNTSLTALESLYETFLNLVEVIKKIKDSQKNSLLESEISILKDVSSYNGQTFYDYELDNEISNFSNIKNSEEAGSYIFPKQITKVDSSKEGSAFTSFNITNEDFEKFKASDEFCSLLFDHLNDKNTTKHMSESIFPYEMLSNYFLYVFDEVNRKIKCSNMEEFKKYLKTLNRAEVTSIYRMFSSGLYNSAKVQKKDEMCEEIIKLMISQTKTYSRLFSLTNIDKIYKNPKSMILFSILFGKSVRMEYLSNFKIDLQTNFSMLKQPIWKLFDKNDPEVQEKISNSKIFIRLVPMNFNCNFFFNDHNTDLSIFTKYMLLGT